MFPKKKFLSCDDRVKIVKAEELSGRTGTILGKSFINVIDGYIVLLDEGITSTYIYDSEIPFFHKAICITESCLEKIE
jgi:hypothetical protein